MPQLDTQRYTDVAKLLHWSVAALVITQYVLAALAERAAEQDNGPAQLLLLANHKSVGMTILLLAVLRLLWRLRHPPPALPANLPTWQRYGAQLTHALLYGLIFFLPVSGWLLSSASAYSVSWFGVFQWPDLIGADPALKKSLATLHEVLAAVLFGTALLHLLAALKHHFYDRDLVLARMASSGVLSLFAILLVGAIWGLGRAAVAVTPIPALPASGITDPVPRASTSASSKVIQTERNSVLPLWNIDYQRSAIGFTAEQAGARFTGQWQRWRADIRFSAEQLASSSALVVIAADSAHTYDADRDSTLSSSAWFAATSYPEVVYRANNFQALPETARGAATEFLADGALEVKGIRVAVPLRFSVVRSGTELTLNGTAELDRLALNLGTGEWADTEAVGQFVIVQVKVVASLTLPDPAVQKETPARTVPRA